MTPIRLGLVLAVSLTAGCGGGSGSGGSAGSGLNPFAWFGGPRDSRVVLEPEGGFGQFEDTRPLVAEVTRVSFAPVIGGAVVSAAGLPATQGYWDGELVAVSADPPADGVLVLEFRLRPPVAPTQASVPRSREVVVGYHITNIRLQRLSGIRVVGAANQRSVRR